MDSRQSQKENRRQFIERAFVFAAALPLINFTNSSCQAQTRQPQRQTPQKIVGGGCDGCESIYEGMPEQLSWETKIAAENEPGERMEINGVIYKADGKTPAPDVILFVYHTDAKGYYSPSPEQTGLARRNGHLRGWMKTNAKGEYKFTSIKPAPYPNRDIPAHVHPIVKEPDKNEYYFDDYWFDDDALLTKEKRATRENRGGSGTIHLTKINGVWTGTRNIVLGLNIPDYK